MFRQVPPCNLAALGLAVAWLGVGAVGLPLGAHAQNWDGYEAFVSVLHETLGPDRVVVPEVIDPAQLPERSAFVFLGADQALPARALVQRLTRGGRVVVLDEKLEENALFAAFHIDVRPLPESAHPALLRGDPQLAIAEAAQRHPLTIGAERLVTNRPRVLYHSELEAIYRIDGQPFVFSGAVGNGRLIAVADASLVIDNMLTFAGNRQWAQNLATFLGTDADKVYVVLPNTRVLGGDTQSESRGRLREALQRLAKMDAPTPALLVSALVLCVLLTLMFLGVVPSRSPYTSEHMVDSAPSPMGISGELEEATPETRIQVAAMLFAHAWERDQKGEVQSSSLRILSEGKPNRPGRPAEKIRSIPPEKPQNPTVEAWKRKTPRDRTALLRWMDEGLTYLPPRTPNKIKRNVQEVPLFSHTHAQTVRTLFLAIEAREKTRQNKSIASP